MSSLNVLLGVCRLLFFVCGCWLQLLHAPVGFRCLFYLYTFLQLFVNCFRMDCVCCCVLGVHWSACVVAFCVKMACDVMVCHNVLFFRMCVKVC